MIEYRVVIDDLRGTEIANLLRAHLSHLASLSPPESCHALNLEKLRDRSVTFWSVWQQAELAGCGALKELNPRHGEVKSMRTVESHLRRGVASLVLRTIIGEARRRGYERLSLETGTQPAFEAAQALYARHGFEYCEPFGEYVLDPNSCFMTLALR